MPQLFTKNKEKLDKPGPKLFQKNKKEKDVEVIIRPIPGPSGKTPTEEELIEIILPLIPEPIPGKNGKDYILKKEDLKKIAEIVKVPVVKQIIVDKRETVIKPEVKEVAKYQTAPQLRDLLESLKKGEKLSIQAIEGLVVELKKIWTELQKDRTGGVGLGLKGSLHAGKGREIRFIDDEVPVNTGDDTNFTLSKTPKPGSLKLYRNGARQKIVEDYTLVGKTITLTTGLQSPSEILLADYRY